MLDGFYRVLASCGHNGFQTAFQGSKMIRPSEKIIAVLGARL
ncbi:hypothetical protein [Neisseria dumasiana]|nr:hypothetical protein [Neisseria dumasiana]